MPKHFNTLRIKISDAEKKQRLKDYKYALKHGFYVGQLQKDGNAYKSGIKPTNIILSIEGVNVSNINGITEMLNSKNKGDIISCEVLSDGIIKEVEIKIYN